MRALIWHDKESSRDLAGKDVEIPSDYRAEGKVADALPALAS
jgi:hypothetical protein